MSEATKYENLNADPTGGATELRHQPVTKVGYASQVTLSNYIPAMLEYQQRVLDLTRIDHGADINILLEYSLVDKMSRITLAQFVAFEMKGNRMAAMLFKLLMAVLLISQDSSVTLALHPASAVSQSREEQCEVIAANNIERLDEVAVLDTPLITASLSWSPENDVIAISTSEGAYLYDLSDFNFSETPVIFGVDRIQDVTFSSEGEFIVSAEDLTQIFSVLTGEVLFQKEANSAYLGSVKSLAFHPTNPLLTILSLNGDIRIWNFETGAENFIEHEGTSNIGAKIVFRSDGSQVAYATFNAVKILDTSTWEEIKDLTFHGLSVRDLTFDPSDAVLAVVDYDGLVIFFETKTYTEVDSVRVNRSAASIAFSPDGTLVAIGSTDQMRLLAASDLETLATPRLELRQPDKDTGDKVRVAFSADGRLLALARWGDESVQVWGVC